ncbi:MAG: ATP-binding cassette domain-containing protein [Herminiimonas sp.]|nr:ATP-binding cassette domain-containing protein [Herminiimonas sp.]
MIDIALTRRLDHPDGALDLTLDQTVERGDFVALFGPSGAGKTSVLRMLAGLSRPDSGRIVVDGTIWFDAARGIDLAPQRRSIGFVFQDHALFPNLSIRANVGYAVGGHDQEWVDELLALMQLSALEGQLPGKLSGGQKQRVALARAVARRPVLLLLDEPLSALDDSLRAQLQDDLAMLHARLGLTTVMVSHDLGEVFRLATVVWRLQDGRIARSGTPADVFLHQRVAGRLALQARILSMQREEVVTIVSLLIGQEIVDLIATDEEVSGLRIGDVVALSAKAFGALRLETPGD